MPIYAEIAITHPITGIRRIIKRVAIEEIIILIPCGNLLRLMKYQNPSDKLANSDERLLESGSKDFNEALDYKIQRKEYDEFNNQ